MGRSTKEGEQYIQGDVIDNQFALRQRVEVSKNSEVVGIGYPEGVGLFIVKDSRGTL